MEQSFSLAVGLKRFLRLEEISRATFKLDLIAGITVALILVPQSLAYAQLAGLPPVYGLYASLLPPIIAALFGSSPQLSTGPVAVVSLMTAAAIAPLAAIGSSEYFMYAALLALMVGSLQFALGIFKLGELVSFLSHPVVYGFTNAAAIIIATTQLPSLFGVLATSHEHHYENVIATIQAAASGAHLPTVLFAIAALAAVIALKKLAPKLPAALIVVVASAVIAWLIDFSGALVGSVPSGIPSMQLPSINREAFGHLLVAAITIAIIGFTEGVSIAQAVAVKLKQRLDPNRELAGQGLANIASAITQGYPVAGSFSRTAVNFQAGAATWLSSAVTAFAVLITLLFFTSLLFYIPKAVLAVLIVVAVAGLIDFKRFALLWRSSRYDGIAALLTFAGTLYFAPHLDLGIALGVVFSLGHFVYRNTHPRVVFLSRYKDRYYHDAVAYNLDHCQNIAVVRLDAPLFFANASYFETSIIQYLADNKRIKYVLLVASGINEIDATGEEMLQGLVESLRKSKKELYFANAKIQVTEMLKRVGLWEEIGADHFLPTTKEAVQHLLRKLEKSHAHADSEHCPLRKYMQLPTAHLEQQRHMRDRIAYAYKKLAVLGRRMI